MGATLESKPKLPGFLSLLLVIALGISAAKLMWLILTPQQQFIPTPQDNGVTTTKQKQATNYGKLIADQHIFGEVVVKKAPKAKDKPIEEPKPVVAKVKLNAKLHGIVAYRSKQGFALISKNNGPQKVYGKGDTLEEGIIISDILPTKVLIDNNGVEEELLLPKKKSAKSSKRQANLPRSNALSFGGGVLPNPTASVANKPTDLNQLRQEILDNPNKLINAVRATPAITNGKFIGFRVRPGNNRRLFRQLNFRANDIITEINGIVLDNANKGVDVLAQLENATSLSIKVKRGNQEVYIDHSF